MKDYLKPYLLPKEFAGQSYNCSRCNSDFVVKKDGPSGNRRTFSICKKCMTELGRIEKYGSLENFKKIQHENLSKSCKEKWQNDSYRKNISEKVKESWKDEAHRKRVSQSVKENWASLSEEEFENRKTLIRESVADSVEKRKEKLEFFRSELQKDGLKYLTIFEACDFLEVSWDILKKGRLLADVKIIEFGNARFLEKSDLLKIQEKLKSLHGRSLKEGEVLDFVKSIYKGKIISNDRTLLDGKELDIYMPEKKLAIEFDGLFWHSDRIDLKNGELPSKEKKEIAKKRHLEKTLTCEKKEVRLIHIFEDDWIFQREKIESLLKNILDPNSSKIIFARKCEVRGLNTKQYKDFLEKYHLQNYSAADLRLGLFYENELVECIGVKTSGNHSKEPELVRLCTKIGCRVTGGFSKLLKHSNQMELVSYIDRATFDGKGYFAVGFKKVLENKPTYFYIKNNTRIPRYKFMRKHIQEKFEKGLLEYWNPEETEEVNMYKNNFGRIWNCGTIKVKWERAEKKIPIL